MENNLLSPAQQLADRPYFTVVQLDQTTDGDPIYVATHPELEGCIGQGKTPVEATRDLASTRLDFILSLLEDNLPVPLPGPTAVTRTGISGVSIDLSDRPQFHKEVSELNVLISFNNTPAD